MAQYEINRFGNDDYIEYSKHKDFSFPPHFHRCLEFIYMIEGEMQINHNGFIGYTKDENKHLVIVPEEVEIILR